MKEMSLSSHDFIMFEDGKSGITGANAAGGKTMGVLGNRPESSLPDAHQYIRDFRGLTPIKLDKIMNSTYVRH